MNKDLKWNELLIIGGFNPTKLSETKFYFKGESKRNLDFLCSIFKEGDILHDERFEEIEILQKPLSFEQWITLLKNIGQRSSGYSSKPDDLDLTAIDVSLLGAIRQLNRLGLNTVWSCDGHGKRNPFISFSQKEHADQCKKLLSRLGYKVRFKSELYIEVLEHDKELYQLGLDLSRMNSTCDLSIKECIYKRNEDVLEDLLMIPGVSGEEEYVREYLMNLLPGLLDEVRVVDYGNILGHKLLCEGPTVLLSAHMDVVDYIDTKSYILKNNNIWKRSTGILGADDRAGVALILNILLQPLKIVQN